MEASVKAAQSPLRIRVAPEEVTVRFWGLRDDPLGTWLRVILGAGASAAVVVHIAGINGSPIDGPGEIGRESVFVRSSGARGLASLVRLWS